MLWLILSVLLWGLLHSLLASLKAKELARRWLGDRPARFYRLGYNVFAGVSFLPVLAVMFLVSDRTLYLVPLPWLLFLVAGELLAVAVLVVGFLQTDAWEFLGLRQLGESDRPSKLTTSGLYHYVRHPLYAAGLAFIWLMPLMTVSVLAINIALTVYVITGAYFEERKLRREFGQDYADYMAVTPMFIPFLKGNKSRRESSSL
ncbi:MAG: isoprenylcysteine carboxylmethyltransferase family protein [Anaerolineales bacterium]|nr:isoprenylcysteine carboxylmethyltransferase family protein [Anaerolineales bacterium]